MKSRENTSAILVAHARFRKAPKRLDIISLTFSIEAGLSVADDFSVYTSESL